MDVIVNVAEAKANLSRYIARAHHGERIILAKNNQPMVELVPYRAAKKRQLGHLAGTFVVPDDFCDESREIEAMFHPPGE